MLTFPSDNRIAESGLSGPKIKCALLELERADTDSHSIRGYKNSTVHGSAEVLIEWNRSGRGETSEQATKTREKCQLGRKKDIRYFKKDRCDRKFRN